MSTKLHAAALCVVSTAGWVAGCDDGYVTRRTPPLIQVSTDRLDFGEVEVGERRSRKVSVINAGDATLVVSSFERTGHVDPYSVTTAPGAIPPDGELEVTIVFAPDRASPFAAELSINSNADNGEVKTVSLMGRGVAPANQPPTQPAVVITPTVARVADDLVAELARPSVDPEGTVVTYTYLWLSGSDIQADLTTERVPASRTSKGDTWRVIVTPSDGELDGPSAEATATVANAAPSIGSVHIEPTAPGTTTDLDAISTGFSDPDSGDAMHLSFAWKVNGQPAGTDRDRLDSAEFVKGDRVMVTVTPFDGAAHGAPVTSAPVQIGNTPPGAATAAITPVDPDEDQHLTCAVTAGAADVDNDSVTYRFAWTSAGTTRAGAFVDAALTSAGETWTCTIIPSDGTDDGTPTQVAVMIQPSSVGCGERDPCASSLPAIANPAVVSPGTHGRRPRALWLGCKLAVADTRSVAPGGGRPHVWFLSASGSALGEVEVSPNNGLFPSLAVRGRALAVTWELPVNGNQNQIMARTFDLDGRSLGPEVLLSDPAAGAYKSPTVAAVNDGFIVLWYGETTSFGIYSAKIDRNGAVTAPQRQVGPASGQLMSGCYTFPSVASGAAGVLATWMHCGSGTRTVYAMPIASDGSSAGPAQLIAAASPNSIAPNWPTLASTPSGFALTYTNDRLSTSPTSGDVYVAITDGAGVIRAGPHNVSAGAWGSGKFWPRLVAGTRRLGLAWYGVTGSERRVYMTTLDAATGLPGAILDLAAPLAIAQPMTDKPFPFVTDAGYGAVMVSDSADLALVTRTCP